MGDAEIIGLYDLRTRYAARLPVDLLAQLPQLQGGTGTILQQVCAGVDTRLIKAERLKTRAAEEPVDAWAAYARQVRGRMTESTAEIFARDLRRRIKDVKTEYGSVSSNLDRTFVTRLLQGAVPVQSAKELIARFEGLEARRKELGTLGLLDLASPSAMSEPKLSTVTELLTEKADVFSLYVADMEEKLTVFDELQAKLEVLRDRVNRRFKYKTMEIDAATGFSFLSHSGVRLNSTDLSSGEQHVVILLYELLFVAQPGDLVLIDEPELSLHIDWQMAFPDDLREAQRVSTIDILVATHSPAIAGAARDLLVPLTGPDVTTSDRG
jgi:predicted ATP-binding protein involved in virulence